MFHFSISKVPLGVGDVNCFSTINCVPGTATYTISASQCCIDKAAGLSYKFSLTSEGCPPCVGKHVSTRMVSNSSPPPPPPPPPPATVYGFILNDGGSAINLTITEGKPQTSVSFGLVKGIVPSPRKVTFTSIPGTASKEARDRFTVHFKH